MMQCLKNRFMNDRILNIHLIYKLIKLTLKHRDYEKLKEGSMWLYNVLNQNLNMPILGPEEPAISRIRNEYIRTILIKIPQEKNLGNNKKNYP